MQGEAEGLQPNEGVFAALIEHMCTQQELEGAAATLELMKVGDAGLAPAMQARRGACSCTCSMCLPYGTARKRADERCSLLKSQPAGRPASLVCRSAAPTRLFSTMRP